MGAFHCFHKCCVGTVSNQAQIAVTTLATLAIGTTVPSLLSPAKSEAKPAAAAPAPAADDIDVEKLVSDFLKENEDKK